jgi:hypothetical protein
MRVRFAPKARAVPPAGPGRGLDFRPDGAEGVRARNSTVPARVPVPWPPHAFSGAD